jgi:hypothetical protein
MVVIGSWGGLEVQRRSPGLLGNVISAAQKKEGNIPQQHTYARRGCHAQLVSSEILFYVILDFLQKTYIYNVMVFLSQESTRISTSMPTYCNLIVMSKRLWNES